ncbi:MAG: hypothetical protein HRT35_04340 [Algicola sp.]|nr:hypothetical protein [Algicola sp.]
MKIDLKIILSMLFGATLVWLFQPSQHSPSLGLINPAFASTYPQVAKIPDGSLDHCEMFFSDDRDFFETEINKRIKKSKLIQSNVIWSETTKQLGFYAMICY